MQKPRSFSQGWAQGSFVEAEAEVKAEARQGSNVLNRGEVRQRQRQIARCRGGINVLCITSNASQWIGSLEQGWAQGSFVEAEARQQCP